RRRHYEARALIVMKGAAPDHVRAVPPELDPRGLHQGHEIRLAFDPLEFRLRDPRHSENLSRGWRKNFTPNSVYRDITLFVSLGQARRDTSNSPLHSLGGRLPWISPWVRR